jgi:negative regulator of flagellin synthesis FlgM
MSIQNIDNKELKRLYQAETTGAHSVGKAAGRETVGKGVGSASNLSGKDQATLSEGARLLADSLAALNNTPDVRTDLVAQLKAKIDAGEYEIPYDELAKKLAAVMKG